MGDIFFIKLLTASFSTRMTWFYCTNLGDVFSWTFSRAVAIFRDKSQLYGLDGEDLNLDICEIVYAAYGLYVYNLWWILAKQNQLS
ncbi:MULTISPECIES: hypothetical protein [unclassified Microcoleus]|uniref:hypothetical protein n=1 Tax=unclassified Microcoleus TaxID=2642155 RepID=UPI002FD29B2E